MTETPQELMAALTAEAAHLPTKTLFQLAWAGLRVRLARSLVTLLSVVLAIAYLSYSGVSSDLVQRLAASKSDEIYTLLRSAGINVEAAAEGNPLDRWLVSMALLTCTVGIANAMLMSVTERFREIGTMKCLGAENGTVVKLFLIESAMIGGVGSADGDSGRPAHLRGRRPGSVRRVRPPVPGVRVRYDVRGIRLPGGRRPVSDRRGLSGARRVPDAPGRSLAGGGINVRANRRRSGARRRPQGHDIVVRAIDVRRTSSAARKSSTRCAA